MTSFLSDEFRLNFSDTGDQLNFDPIPSGMYHCQITDASVRAASERAKNPGAPSIRTEFTVASGEYEGRKVFDNITIVEDDEKEDPVWKRRLKGLLGSLGYDTTGELAFEVPNFIGRELDLKVGTQAKSVDPVTKQEYPPKNTAQSFYPHEMTDTDMLS